MTLPAERLVRTDEERRGRSAGPRRSWASAQPFEPRPTPFNSTVARSLRWAEVSTAYQWRAVALDALAVVPAEIVDRPKMGFTVPVDAWLRGPLREWAESLLDANAIRDEGVFDAAALRAAWQDFLQGGRSSGLGMWTLLQYRAWSAEWGATA